MENYIGVKAVKAKAMTLGEYNKYRGWEIPAEEDPAAEGYLVEYPADPESKPNHSDHEGYISWSPKHVFEKSYMNCPDDRKLLVQPELLFMAHEHRVIEERHALAEKVEKLGTFMRTPFFQTLKDKELLMNQHLAMKYYLEILNNRILGFERREDKSGL